MEFRIQRPQYLELFVEKLRVVTVNQMVIGTVRCRWKTNGIVRPCFINLPVNTFTVCIGSRNDIPETTMGMIRRQGYFIKTENVAGG